ncbi:MAG: PEGA domain-containing protein [Kofleriaceae bacterium]
MRRLLLVAALAGTAHAQPKDPAPEGKVDAQSLMTSGNKLYDQKDYLGALAVFKTAYANFQSSKILINIGSTLKQLGRDADAANAYQRYLDAKDADPKKKAEIQKLVDKLDKSVGKLTITPTPSDAVISVDDDDSLHVVRGASWRVADGKHVLTIKADGYETKTKNVTAAAGEEISLEIQLVAIPKPVPRIITVPVNGTGIEAHVKPEEPRSRFGAIVFGHFDIPHGGAAIVGATADIIDHVTVRAGALLGPHYGGYGGVTYDILTKQYRPYVTAGAPIIYSHGARYAIRGAVGFEYDVNRHVALVIEAGVEHLFDPEMDVKATSFVPAAGVIGRL